MTKLEFSDADIYDICLSYDHSFGLMNAEARGMLIFKCKEWIRAISKNIGSKFGPAVQKEPSPIQSTGDIWKDVQSDMEQRRKFGINKYGTPLQAHNGRNPLVDAYQEALDLVVYLKQAIEELDDRMRNDGPEVA